jgi:hypothetical protein
LYLSRLIERNRSEVYHDLFEDCDRDLGDCIGYGAIFFCKPEGTPVFAIYIWISRNHFPKLICADSIMHFAHKASSKCTATVSSQELRK